MPCHDLVPAGDQFRHADGRLVGLRAGGQQQHLAQRLGQRLGEPSREVHHRPAEHAAEQVIKGGRLPLDRLHDRRVGMPEDGAHLPGREVEEPTTVGGVHEAALGPFDDLRNEAAGAGVAHEMTFDIGPEGVGHALTLGTDRASRPARLFAFAVKQSRTVGR
jgi:hypothetical protein